MHSQDLLQSVCERKMLRLIQLVRHTPAVRSSILRVLNEIVPPAVLIQEKGKELTPVLHNFLGPILSAFLERAVEMAYMCGFVAFVCRKHEGVPVPVVMPLGSFTWSVEVVTQKTKKRKREPVCLYRYHVRPLHPEITPDDVVVFNFQEPIVDNGEILASPLDFLAELQEVIQQMQKKLEAVIEWNSSKHIATSERVDNPKDQTTEGISLLDEFRRYLITGTHSGVNRYYMTMNGDVAPHTTDPTDMSAKYIHGAFETSQVKTNVHVLPPNTEVSELTALDPKLNLLELQELFNRHVIQFFHMTTQSEVSNSTKREYGNTGDIKYMRHMARFARRLLQFTYAFLFDLDEKDVVVVLDDPSMFGMNSIEDIKVLADTEILLPSDKLRIRKSIMRCI
jgi:hypothetical protein